MPTPEEIGHCDKVYLDEIGDTEVVIFHQGKPFDTLYLITQRLTSLYFVDNDRSQVSTIIIRGSSDNLMDDIERAIDDAVNNVKALTKVSIWI